MEWGWVVKGLIIYAAAAFTLRIIADALFIARRNADAQAEAEAEARRAEDSANPPRGAAGQGAFRSADTIPTAERL